MVFPLCTCRQDVDLSVELPDLLVVRAVVVVSVELRQLDAVPVMLREHLFSCLMSVEL